MNVTVTIEIKDNEEHITTEKFNYEYEPTKEKFISKMTEEVKAQMGQNMTPSQMEAMMKEAHPPAVFDFAVCSDWIIDNIKPIADKIKRDSASYKVLSFELVNDGGVSEVKYDNTNDDLRDMLNYMNKDFDDMIKTA
jgi:predicted RecB family nuclease